jgi:pimeloyl-ACP methyl ester carboxylesterase
MEARRLTVVAGATALAAAAAVLILYRRKRRRDPILAYDEFGLFHENCSEFGIAYEGPPVVRRVSVELPDGRKMSALKWGDAPPQLVLLHGGGQNAHTWDTVALALKRPLLALDLPSHGHSDNGLNVLDPTSAAADAVHLT